MSDKGFMYLSNYYFFRQGKPNEAKMYLFKNKFLNCCGEEHKLIYTEISFGCEAAAMIAILNL